MQTGTVKFFNEARGYGFIVDDESQKEIFVHVTGLGGLVIREKDRVEYEIVDGNSGEVERFQFSEVKLLLIFSFQNFLSLFFN